MGTGSDAPTNVQKSGVLFGLSAYGLWGFLPVYWRLLSRVPPLQILSHRIAWAFLFTGSLSVILKRGPAVRALFKDRKRLVATLAAGLMVTANWGIYIWAVNSGEIIETSLGYFLNPLVSVALGAFVLREKLDRGILAASALAVIGIAVQTAAYGRLPWIALVLALTFAVYGLIKKMVGLDALLGLAMETSVVLPFALAFLVFEHAAGRGSFGALGARETALLIVSGFVTALPLFLYAEGVKRIPLSRMGFLQYISPTTQLLLGVFVYGEALGTTKAVSFGFILIALVVFALTRKKPAL